ncbi:head decoration protein [Pseudooceanicola sp. CBS1P-1]|uniref:Head decoration protein n=1 Tax=Pseudooceanicola albus TaxID=2692189 RepID=A0A6L7FX64_9RHOB|nr:MULTISPECIES: head decoration protein [Pseudooceanicola]MBT9383322.1 head decoration protein [Pseudooceanicola endophyticus]MXN16355.1 head decoration protein [Pseudooceanicola albus]
MEKVTMMTRNLSFLLSHAAGTRSFNTITIAAGEGELAPGTVLGKVTASDLYVVSPEAETVGKEGAETALAVLAYAVDATDADVDALVVDADAEVKVGMLTFDATVDDETKTDAKLAQLTAAGIRAR